MKLELDVNDEAFDHIFVSIVKDHLEYTRWCIDKAKTGKLVGVYSWEDQQLELKELMKDEKAYMRLLLIYGEEA